MTSSTMNWFNLYRNISIHDVHNKLFISFDKALNKNLPSGITLSGNFALTRLQWPDMNTSNIEIHNFKINWKVPSHCYKIASQFRYHLGYQVNLILCTIIHIA
jgi:hypothetical protein